jgi:hypothetical protein
MTDAGQDPEELEDLSPRDDESDAPRADDAGGAGNPPPSPPQPPASGQGQGEPRHPGGEPVLPFPDRIM